MTRTGWPHQGPTACPPGHDDSEQECRGSATLSSTKSWASDHPGLMTVLIITAAVILSFSFGLLLKRSTLTENDKEVLATVFAVGAAFVGFLAYVVWSS